MFEALKDIAINVIGSILFTVLAITFAESRGWITIRWRRFTSGRKLFHRIQEAGIVNFYASRADYTMYRGAPNLADYLRCAKRSIRVAGYWMAHGIEMEGVTAALDELTRASPPRDITIALINPRASYVHALSGYLGLQQEEVVARTKASLSKLWDLREHMTPAQKARFRIKVYETVPIASVILLDAEESYGRLQIEIKPYKSPRTASFALELGDRGHELYDTCANAWLQLIDDSPDMNPDVHLQ